MKVPLFPLLAGWLLTLAAGSVWAETPATDSTHTPASNIEGWNEEGNEEDLQNNWTWFGMGYESRISGNSGSVAAGSRSSGVGAAGVGGASAVMNQRGRGGR